MMNSSYVGVARVPSTLTYPVVVVDVLRAFTTSAWVLSSHPTSPSLSATRSDALGSSTSWGLERSRSPMVNYLRDSTLATLQAKRHTSRSKSIR